MKRFIFILATFALPIVVVAATPESQALSKAESMVDALFRDFVKVSSPNTNPNDISRIKEGFEKYFRNNDQNCPNEFRIISNSPYGDVRPASYFREFNNFFREFKDMNYSFTYEPQNSCVVGRQPVFGKGEEAATLVQVVVRKIYKRGGKKFAAYNDTLRVGIEEMKIRAWANQASQHPIGHSGGEILDIEQLKDNAEQAYNDKQYHKAYQIYQFIVNKYPKEGDPYYRMAIMLYKKDYGSSMRKKERQRLILEYLDKAIQNGGSSTRHWADNMKYWLTC